MSSEHEFYSDEPYFGERPQDPKTQKLKRILLTQLESDRDKVYYQRQLEVIYEKQYFHWITDRAIRELENERLILVEWWPIRIGLYSDEIKIITSRRNRYFRRNAKEIASLIEEYADPAVTQDIGFMGETLFKLAYAASGFCLVGENTNEFDGKKWIKTNHDIDFIVEKRGKLFGCEVKNTLGYIDKREMETKLQLCKFLGLVPIFIVRYSPKVWNHELFNQRALIQIFETQIFPPGRADLANRLRNKLSLPVQASRQIPLSIMARLNHVLETRVFRS